MQNHPGGSGIILKYAGGDATLVYEPIHPPDALEKNLPPSNHLGHLKPDDALILSQAQKSRQATKDELRVEAALRRRPLLKRILSLADMEVGFSFRISRLLTSLYQVVARQILSHKAFAYYSSAADDQICTLLSSPS